MTIPGCAVIVVLRARGFNSACSSVEGTAATCPGTSGLFSVSTCPWGVITRLAAVSVREDEVSSVKKETHKSVIYSGIAALMANDILQPRVPYSCLRDPG